MRAALLAGLIVAFAGVRGGAEGLAPRAVTSSISATQLTLRLDSLQGQATVIDEAGTTLTIVTAAHFLGPDDVGKTLSIHHCNGNLKGKVEAVTPNPGYHPFRARGLPDSATYGTLGVDTAVVDIRVEVPTAREREIFEMVANGRSGPEIARALHISPKTVESHRYKINRKLGVRSPADTRVIRSRA